MFTATEQAPRYTGKWKEQDGGQMCSLNHCIKRRVMCLAMHRKALEGHKILVIVIAFGGENWDTRG